MVYSVRQIAQAFRAQSMQVPRGLVEMRREFADHRNCNDINPITLRDGVDLTTITNDLGLETNRLPDNIIYEGKVDVLKLRQFASEIEANKKCRGNYFHPAEAVSLIAGRYGLEEEVFEPFNIVIAMNELKGAEIEKRVVLAASYAKYLTGVATSEDFDPAALIASLAVVEEWKTPEFLAKTARQMVKEDNDEVFLEDTEDKRREFLVDAMLFLIKNHSPHSTYDGRIKQVSWIIAAFHPEGEDDSNNSRMRFVDQAVLGPKGTGLVKFICGEETKEKTIILADLVANLYRSEKDRALFLEKFLSKSQAGMSLQNMKQLAKIVKHYQPSLVNRVRFCNYFDESIREQLIALSIGQ